MTVASRHTVRRADHIEYAFWLTFAQDGGIRLSRGEPSVGRNERAMRLTAKLPISLFEVPSLRAEINITDHAATVPPIDLTAAGEALRSVLGCDVVMTLHDAGDPS